jgi:hypothetical protein
MTGREYCGLPCSSATLRLTVHSPPSMTATRIIRIHIHAISTNAIHPQAQQSPLQLTVVPKHDRANTYTTAVLQIAYGVVAVHFRFHGHSAGGEARALVWDWTTSDLLLVRTNIMLFCNIFHIKQHRTPLHLSIPLLLLWNMTSCFSIPHTFS